MISRSTLTTVPAFIAIFVVNVTALWTVDIIRFAPHFGLHKTCNHVGPGALIIIGVMSLAATAVIGLSAHLFAPKIQKASIPARQVAIPNLETLIATLLLAGAVVFLAAIGVWFWIAEHP
jgi:ABC-type transporter Mla maintaining outer membrane lipid asymmetry permease subunit MlaE